jgi:hypothetical protein
MSSTNRMWETKKASLKATAQDIHQRSPVASLLEIHDMGDEWRSLWLLNTATLVQRPDGAINQAGPVMIGIRYHVSFLAETPHPMAIVTLLLPPRVFHPNVAIGSGAYCCGRVETGFGLETILHQAWAGITLNMRIVNTRGGEILNVDAARFVRSNAERFPLTEKGIFETPNPKTPQ